MYPHPTPVHIRFRGEKCPIYVRVEEGIPSISPDQCGLDPVSWPIEMKGHLEDRAPRIFDPLTHSRVRPPGRKCVRAAPGLVRRGMTCMHFQGASMFGSHTFRLRLLLASVRTSGRGAGCQSSGTSVARRSEASATGLRLQARPGRPRPPLKTTTDSIVFRRLCGHE